MFTTIINDCRDQNAAGRQCTRFASLTGITPSFIGVQNDLEAAGCLVDTLDASGGVRGLILVNVAPRNKEAHHWQNGTPFGFFKYQETTVIAAVSGHTLSLVKKLGITDTINLVDIPLVLEKATEQGFFSKELSEQVTWSQFRSFDFLPRLGSWMKAGFVPPYQPRDFDGVPNMDSAVWWIDCFGNCKTTLIPEEIGFSEGKKIKTKFGSLACFEHLRDVPDNEAALVVGSSGIGNRRFVELVVQGGSAGERFGCRVGDVLL